MLVGRLAPAPRSPASGSLRVLAEEPLRIDLPALRRLQDGGEPVVLLDARSERNWDAADTQARGALRLPPDRAAREAERLALPRDAWLVAYCA
jgi:rhodanese-related sulfurtransferase